MRTSLPSHPQRPARARALAEAQELLQTGAVLLDILQTYTAKLQQLLTVIEHGRAERRSPAFTSQASTGKSSRPLPRETLRHAKHV